MSYDFVNSLAFILIFEHDQCVSLSGGGGPAVKTPHSNVSYSAGVVTR